MLVVSQHNFVEDFRRVIDKRDLVRDDIEQLDLLKIHG